MDFANLTPFLLITYHPETQKGTPQQDMQNLLDALDETDGYNMIFTKSNADAGGEIINKMVDEWCAKNSH